MQVHETKRTILVPVLDGDITEETLAMARPLVAGKDTRLVLVHVASTDGTGRLLDDAPSVKRATSDCRWKRLASVAPDRTFVEAVAGDPTTVVIEEAERFGDDTIVLGPVAVERNSVDVSFSRVVLEHKIAPAAIDALVDALPVAVLVADGRGRVLFANAEARALHVEQLDRVQWAVTRALLTEDVVREDDIELVTDGEPRRWMSALITPLRNTGAPVHAAFVVISDVTARKRLDSWTPLIESLVNL
jgi:PAS domain-containing protein